MRCGARVPNENLLHESEVIFQCLSLFVEPTVFVCLTKDMTEW
jgi:hypothetical protein